MAATKMEKSFFISANIIIYGNKRTSILGISGASADEQSWADCRDYDYNLWMCDRFSRNIILYLSDNPEATYRNLFLYCSANSLGSHPRIIPGVEFGNLYVGKPKDFINNN